MPGGWHFHGTAHRQSHTICDTRQTDPQWGRATKCYLPGMKAVGRDQGELTRCKVWGQLVPGAARQGGRSPDSTKCPLTARLGRPEARWGLLASGPALQLAGHSQRPAEQDAPASTEPESQHLSRPLLVPDSQLALSSRIRPVPRQPEYGPNPPNCFPCHLALRAPIGKPAFFLFNQTKIHFLPPFSEQPLSRKVPPAQGL